MSSAEYFSDYYMEHRDQIRAAQRAYYERKRQELIHNASARKLIQKFKNPIMRGTGQNSAWQRSVIKNDPCSYCGSSEGGVDHIVPRCEEGADDFSNVTSACFACNRRKSATSLLFFLMEECSRAAV